jgi:hypothetical protein
VLVFAACGRDLRKPPPVQEWCDRRRLYYLCLLTGVKR